MKTIGAAILMTLALTLNLSVIPVASTSDPSAGLCEQTCWEQDVLAQTCETQNNCDIDTMEEGEYLACARQCWGESSGCMRMCRDLFEPVLDFCQPQCRGRRRGHCRVTCFMDRMLSLMASYRASHGGQLAGYSTGDAVDMDDNV